VHISTRLLLFYFGTYIFSQGDTFRHPLLTKKKNRDKEKKMVYPSTSQLSTDCCLGAKFLLPFRGCWLLKIGTALFSARHPLATKSHLLLPTLTGFRLFFFFFVAHLKHLYLVRKSSTEQKENLTLHQPPYLPPSSKPPLKAFNEFR
jgi:hypothetical protein